MHVRFGLQLDGLNPSVPMDELGAVTVGPQGLLRMLESDLGLPPDAVHPAEALVVYQGVLAELGGPQRFYQASFEVDPINVARRLMRWREIWYLAGWRGDARDDSPQRVADMAAVEARASALVHCEGQRAQRVAAALRQGGRTQIGRVTLLDPWEEVPAAWRAVLSGLNVERTPEPDRDDDSDLARTFRALSAGAESELRGDESFLVVRSASRDLSAQYLAELAQGWPQESVVIAERDGVILDNAFERAGAPRMGFQHYSPFRAVSQVIKLAMGLMWRPTDPRLLLQFLLHPVCPLTRRTRRALSEAVSREPGVGGTAWRSAIADLAQEQQAEVTRWLLSERFDADAGAPISALSERTRLVAQWLSGQLGRPQGSAEFAAALSQATALLTALRRREEQGADVLGRIELESLIEEAISPQPDVQTFGQVGHLRAATHPGAVHAGCERLAWWGPTSGSESDEGWWSQAELAALDALGVELPPLDERMNWRVRRWLRPFCYARKQLVLVVHDDEDAMHPIWVRLNSLVKGWREVRVEDALLGREPAEPVETSPHPVRPLPVPRRWWRLPDHAFPARDVESYSSLNLLFHAPYRWVLRYAARLRLGFAEDLTDSGRLYGNLAHRLFEDFFALHPSSWRDVDVPGWVHAYLPGLIEREGAVLLEPGRAVDRQEVAATLESALQRLLEHLDSADVRSVLAEATLQAEFAGATQLRGTLDLLLTGPGGSRLVIDAKYGSENFRAGELASSQHVQLVTYGHLLKSSDGGGWPELAYFIVRSGNLLTHQPGAFPEAVVCAGDDAARNEEIWSAVLETYRWRRRQLGAGLIEVPLPGLPAGADSEPPEGALAAQQLSDRYDDFSHLIGWEALE